MHQPRIDEFDRSFLLRLKLEPLIKEFKEFLAHRKEDLRQFSYLLFRAKEALGLRYGELSDLCSAPAKTVRKWAERGGGPDLVVQRVVIMTKLQGMVEDAYQAI